METCQLDDVCEGSDCICNTINNIIKLGGDSISSLSVNADDDVDCVQEGLQIIIIHENYAQKIC